MTQTHQFIHVCPCLQSAFDATEFLAQISCFSLNSWLFLIVWPLIASHNTPQHSHLLSLPLLFLFIFFFCSVLANLFLFFYLHTEGNIPRHWGWWVDSGTSQGHFRVCLPLFTPHQIHWSIAHCCRKTTEIAQVGKIGYFHRLWGCLVLFLMWQILMPSHPRLACDKWVATFY